MSSEKIRIGILGASGYTGAELVRILAGHPNANIVLMTADRRAGNAFSDVYPHLGSLNLPGLIAVDDVEWAGVELDAVFCGLPHGTTQEIIAGILHNTHHSLADELVRETDGDLASAIQNQPKVIDLSADFRLDSVDTYAEWYGHQHHAPHLQGEAVYGLAEFYREEMRDTRLIACPGCFPTSALLALLPLVKAEMIDNSDIIIDAKTGVTGAGRAPKEGMLHGEVSEGLHAYNIASHRHGPEIEQELSKAAGDDMRVSFTAHLAPMNRGILATSYVRVKNGLSTDDLRQQLHETYAEEPFVRVLDEGQSPATRHVRGSNMALVSVFKDRIKDRAIVLCAIDNLVKGASGAAVQNMNIAFGLEETLGLTQQPLFP